MSTLNSKITRLKAQIEAKQFAVNELTDSVNLLKNPPKYEIAAGQLPFFEQVRSLMDEHKDDNERQSALIAAQGVLEKAQSELQDLEDELSRLESERDCTLAIAEIKQAAAAYNAAAKELLKQGENLRKVSMECGIVLHRAGKLTNIFSTDLSSSLGFAIAFDNGSVYPRRLLDLTVEQRFELGLD